MAFEKISDNLHRLNENIREFGKSSAEYYKLDLFNKGMKGATSLVKLLVLGFFLLLALFFISFALSVLISEAIGVPSSGFFIIGAFYLVLFFVVKLRCGKYIEKILLLRFSELYFSQFNEEEELESETDLYDEEV